VSALSRVLVFRAITVLTATVVCTRCFEQEFAILYCKVVFQLLENASLCRGKTLKPKLYHVCVGPATLVCCTVCSPLTPLCAGSFSR
jgi:hypothetical protein